MSPKSVLRPFGARLECACAKWPNRLIGDEQLPPENEYNFAGRGISRVPDWYEKGEPKPAGGWITFATWKFYSKDDPLLASGQLGPVRLLHPVRRVFGE